MQIVITLDDTDEVDRVELILKACTAVHAVLPPREQTPEEPA